MDVLTTGRILSSWAHIDPDSTALLDGKTGDHLTYRELDRMSNRLARNLDANGLRPNDVIAYLMAGPLETVALLFAVGKLGAAWTPLNPRATVADWVRQMDHAGVAALIYDAPLAERIDVLQDALPTVRAWLPWERLQAQSGSSGEFPAAVSASQRVGILYTSGTTGVPKGAWHTHQTLWGWNYSLIQSLGMQRDDRLLNPYPLFHMGGIGFTLAAIQAGASVVLETPFKATHFAESAVRYGGTVTLMVPTMVQALLELPEPFWSRMRSGPLRHLVTTSAPLMTQTGEDMRQAWPGLGLSVLYSATEAIYSLLRYDNPPGNLCVGRPAFGVELNVLDAQKNRCPAGTLGTIYVRGLSVFEGYHRAPDQFQAWHEEWFTCNDVGYLDANGYLYLIDREKDLINSGGEKISSLEIENVLRSHPDIREVGVVGIPDRYWGERIQAAVVLRDSALTEAQLLQFARERLPRYKVPKSFVFVAELPKTDTGKILKRALRHLDVSADLH